MELFVLFDYILIIENNIYCNIYHEYNIIDLIIKSIFNS